MQEAYIINEKLKSLSTRIKNITEKIPYHLESTHQTINLENLQYNLSLILSKMILKATSTDISEQSFINFIQVYNTKNSTNFTLDNFLDKCWIRLILNDVLIPEQIRHLLWCVTHNNDISMREDIAEIFQCLQAYYNLNFNEYNSSISKSDIEQIINQNGRNSLSLQFLLNNNILENTADANTYNFCINNAYFRNLSPEIFMHLWLYFGCCTTEFIICIIKTGMFQFNKLDNLMQKEFKQSICMAASAIISQEKDLNNSDKEVEKIWLDHNYRSLDFDLKLPSFSPNCASAYDLITSIKNTSYYIRDPFNHQPSRDRYYKLLDLIVCMSAFEISPDQSIPYEMVLNLLKDVSKPYIPWKLYCIFQHDYPYIMPYLLVDPQTIPIALELVDDMRVNEISVTTSDSSDYITKTKAVLNTKNNLWLEMFNFILDQIEKQSSMNEFSQYNYIAIILSELANKIFKKVSFNGADDNLEHEILLSRYKSALTILTIKNFYHNPHARHTTQKIINHILPMLFIEAQKYLEQEYDDIEHGFLKISCGSIYHAIELLKITDKIFDNSQDVEQDNNSRNNLVGALFKQIKQFYILDLIKEKNTSIEKKPKRGVSEVGFEIIDWGYAYMEFMRNDTLLETLNDAVFDVIIFDTESEDGKYDEQNQEQYNKIKLFLKSLMLAYISINKNKNYYETQRLPVIPTISLIEQLIKEYSIKYSIDDIDNQQIDIFYDNYVINGNGLYYQSPKTLLYQCVNYFEIESALKFIEAFFDKSIDIGRMLTAVNMIDSKKLKDFISNRIERIKVDDYVNSVNWIPEIQQALVDATNSERHWKQYAQLLFDIVKRHFETRDPGNQNIKNLLFEIRLVLAFKANKKEEFNKIDIPQNEQTYPKVDPKNVALKDFYSALFDLYHEKNYDIAIKKLKILQSSNQNDVKYIFHIYRAKTLKAISEDLNKNLLIDANNEFNQNIETLKSYNEFNKELQKLDPYIKYDSLFYLISI